MKTLGIIANCGKPDAPAVLEQLSARASSLGLDILADAASGDLLAGASVVPFDEMASRADAIMALGGDGTMLRVVRELDGRDKPVIGVNIGSLGFMTSVAMEDLDRALECLAKDDIRLIDNAVAECAVRTASGDVGGYRAVNDIVVRSASVRVITLDVSLDDEPVNSYVCDGLIVSTPMGSTGHSLSAGGPILSPETRAFVISLICPHTLSSRPLVVPDQGRLSITVAESPGDVLLSSDGQVGQKLAEGDRVDIWRSEKGVRFIRLPGYNYYTVLRQKLRWSGSTDQRAET